MSQTRRLAAILAADARWSASSVPRDRVMVFSRTLRPDSFPEIDPRSEPFSLHPQNLPYRCAVIDRQMSPQTGEAMTKRDRRPVAFNLTISL